MRPIAWNIKKNISELQFVDYIQPIGRESDSYIRTGIYFPNGTRLGYVIEAGAVKFHYEVTPVFMITSSNSNFFSTNVTSTQFNFIVYADRVIHSGQQYWWGWNNSSYNERFIENSIMKIEIPYVSSGAPNKTKLNDSLEIPFNGSTISEFTPQYELALCASSGSFGFKSAGDNLLFRRIAFYNSTTNKIYDFNAAILNGVVGVYETVNETFYPASGKFNVKKYSS